HSLNELITCSMTQSIICDLKIIKVYHKNSSRVTITLTALFLFDNKLIPSTTVEKSSHWVGHCFHFKTLSFTYVLSSFHISLSRITEYLCDELEEWSIFNKDCRLRFGINCT